MDKAPIMTKKERAHINVLKERKELLDRRLADTATRNTQEMVAERNALTWVLNKIPCTYPFSPHWRPVMLRHLPYAMNTLPFDASVTAIGAAIRKHQQ